MKDKKYLGVAQKEDGIGVWRTKDSRNQTKYISENEHRAKR